MNWTLHPASRFAQYKDTWGAINAAGADSPLLHTDFIEPLLQHFAAGGELLAICGDIANARAMALLTSRKPGIWETFQPSQAPLAAWVCTPSLSWEVDLPNLLRTLPGLPLILGITQQDPDILPRPLDTGSIRTLDYIQTARITTRGSFEEYWAARGKNLRHNMKRQRNRLEKEGIATRLESLTHPDEIRRAIQNYGDLESAGWKSQTGTAIHPENAQGRYYTEMLERFARRGEARIYQYWYDEQLAAMDLCIERNGALIILKTTYDERQTTSSPAFLMRQEVFKQVFDAAKIRRIEFYGKLMDWHTKWSDEIRTMYHVNCYRWPFLPRLLHRSRTPAASSA